MITTNQLVSMLELQNTMNAKVNPSWKTAGYPWLRAVMVEGVEALGHWGWKWWKKEEPNIAQFRIELVDIWHFALSNSIIDAPGFDFGTVADSIRHQLNNDYSREGLYSGARFVKFRELSTLQRVDLMIGYAAVGKFSYPLFETLMNDAGLTWAGLHSGYVAKNVLNIFRQDHGYKTGEYIKDWFGKEDNVVLEELCATLDSTSPAFVYDLMIQLNTRYAEVLASTPVAAPIRVGEIAVDHHAV